MIAADLHSHTNCSHGVAPAAAMISAGANTGLKYMAISEHSPLPPGFQCALYTDGLERNFYCLMEELRKAQAQNESLLIGLELDWTPSNYGWMKDIANSCKFDHILGSLHYLDGKSVGNPASWPEELSLAEHYERFEAYYYEMAAMCSSGLVDIAAHTDFIKLRVWKIFHKWLDTRDAEKAIAHALSAMKKHGVSLEINTAGLRQPFQEIYPCSKIMKMAREHDISISFGSDAHRPEDVTAGFDEAESWAKQHGYEN